MSTSITVRITEATHQLLHDLAKQSGQTMMDILEKALDAYRRQVFFEKMNSGYGKLRANPKGWAEFERERKQLDGTLGDGLDPAENWTEDGICQTPRKERT